MLFSVACGFVSAFAWSLHQCFHSADPYGESPFGVTFLVVDLIIAIICGTVIMVVAVGTAAVAFRYLLVRGLTDRRLLIVIVFVSAIITLYLCIANPPRLGLCRLD
jgi:hypothetical protein